MRTLVNLGGILLAMLLPLAARAEGFTRPIPQAQSATAEALFFIASVAMVAALVLVQVLVRRR